MTNEVGKVVMKNQKKLSSVRDREKGVRVCMCVRANSQHDRQIIGLVIRRTALENAKEKSARTETGR